MGIILQREIIKYSWLDVGCGYPSLFHFPLSKPALHLDISGKAWHLDVQASCTALPFKNNSFDGIHCANLLEHLITPYQVLQDFKRIARAHCVIKVPNALYSSYVGEGRNHLYSWNQHTLYSLLNRIFRKVEIQETVAIPPKLRGLTKSAVRMAILSRFVKPQELTAFCWVS